MTKPDAVETYKGVEIELYNAYWMPQPKPYDDSHCLEWDKHCTLNEWIWDKTREDMYYDLGSPDNIDELVDKALESMEDYEAKVRHYLGIPKDCFIMQITWREIGGWNDVRVYHGVDDTEIIPIFIVWGKGEDFDWYVHDLVGWGKGEAVEVVIPKIPESFVSFTYKDAINLAHELIDEYLVEQYVHAQEVVE